MNSKKALFIGRFQPPHKGHILAIKYLANKYSQVIVAIGSSKESRVNKNPFTAAERKFLLKKIINSNTLLKNKIKFTYLPDNKSNILWTKNILKRFNKLDHIICSKNPLVNKLLKKVGYEFDTLKYINRGNLKATHIRNKIKTKKQYDQSIDKSISIWMRKKGESIIKKSK